MNKASSYWDLTEQERATLTEDEVTQHEDYELMQAGIVRVAEVEEPPKPTLPEPDLTVYRLKRGHTESDIAWLTAEEAATVRSGAMWISRHYFGNYSTSVSVVNEEAGETEVIGVAAYSKAAYDRHRADMERYGEAEKQLTDQRRAYEKSCEAQRKALEGMWEDWHRCRKLAAEAQQVKATRREYIELCDGDADLAATFLAKAYDEERIKAAAAWERGEAY